MALRLVDILALAGGVAVLGGGQAGGAQAPLADSPPPRVIGAATTARPKAIPGGFDLPNGWRITPAGAVVADLNDLVLKLEPSPDGRAIAAVNSGYLPHGVSLIDPRRRQAVQTLPLKSTWLGLAWSRDGARLFVSGGNANGEKTVAASVAPIYVFAYRNGRLSATPSATFTDPTLAKNEVWWAGLEADGRRGLLYAVNRGTSTDQPSKVVVFDMKTGEVRDRITVGVTPYEARLSADGRRLFVSNWADRTVSVIDAGTRKVVKTIAVGPNPNDIIALNDGRMAVVCSGDNTVRMIGSRTLEVTETISTALYPGAPEGSTPNALAYDAKRRLLFAANADNNDVAVIDVRDKARSAVRGFIPTGWYPSALAVAEGGRALYVGAAKGEAAYPDPHGPESPLARKRGGDESIKTLQRSTVERVPLARLFASLKTYSAQAIQNSPFAPALLTAARAPAAPTVIPAKVGQGSPIKHVIYIIRENRTYDQVLGDLPRGDGDPRLTIFGRSVTPNAHALAETFVTFDNCYADGEVSEDGHSWSDGAYATDQNEKSWPANYGGHSQSAVRSMAYMPPAGYLWDAARRAGKTYRSYGEYAVRVSQGAGMEALPGVSGLVGHVSKDYPAFVGRDTDKVKIFLSDFDAYEAAYDSPDPQKRLPAFTIMSMPEDHTVGASPNGFAPTAMVASNDLAVGQLIDRVSHSRYWPETAIFIIEDDAQDGPDHVDARRTVCLAVSPYVKRQTVDSTLYSTSSMIRTIELLLGLAPLSQYDAAAVPFFAAFSDKPDLTPYTARPAEVDLNLKNTPASYGAKDSARMDFTDVDRAPMRRLNEILWKTVRGEASPMPPPVHRYRPISDVSDGGR